MTNLPRPTDLSKLSPLEGRWFRHICLGSDYVARRYFSKWLRPMPRMVKETSVGTDRKDMNDCIAAGCVGFEFIYEPTGDKFYWSLEIALAEHQKLRLRADYE